MQRNTETKLSAYLKKVGEQNEVSDATQKFNVTPNGAQKIIAQLRESNWFLGKINIVPVKN